MFLIAVRGRVRREGAVIHMIAHNLTDLSELLRSLGDRDEVFPSAQGRGDPAGQAGCGPDPCEASGRKRQDAPVSDSRPGPEIKVPTRDFR